MSRRGNENGTPGWSLLRRSDQAVVAAAILAGCLAMTCRWMWYETRQGGLVDIDETKFSAPEFLLDVNQAEWPELALLPNIGERLAQRMIRSRETEGPFETHEDLLRVHGIGPKTLAAIRPYLRPLTTSSGATPSQPDP